MDFLNEPLLTEDGFLNEACANELNAYLSNMPKTYERCADDPEWNTKRITNWREIVAALAYWAINQINSSSPTITHPPGLEKVLGFLSHSISSKFDKKTGWAEISLCDISQMLYDILYEQGISIFDGWNTKEVMRDHWLDLDALLHNICLTIRDNRREFDRFNKEFEEQQSNS